MGNMYMSPTSAAIHQKRDNDHPPLEDIRFDLRDWLISPKTPKLFEHFDGKPESYPNWSSRVKDHLMASNISWGRLLEIVEKEKTPLTKQRLAAIPYTDSAQIDLLKVSQVLWSFLGNHGFANPVYQRRLQLTQGKDSNGFELWRALFQENAGGAEHVIMWGGVPADF